MKGILVPVAMLGFVAAGYTQVNLNLDNPFQTVVAPTSGSLVVTYSGTVDISNGWDAVSASVEFPFLTDGSAFLGNILFTNDFLTYLGAGADVDYSGSLFTITIDSTTPAGEYWLDSSLTNASEIAINATKGSANFNDNEAYSLTVEAVPEPASMAALGLGALALLRRRRK